MRTRPHGKHDDIALLKVDSSCIGKKGHRRRDELLNSARATWYEFNASPETEDDFKDGHVENVPYATILLPPCFRPLFHHSHFFPLIMAAGYFGPYHRLWSNDAPSKRIVVPPTPWAMMHALGFVVTLGCASCCSSPPNDVFVRFVF